MTDSSPSLRESYRALMTAHAEMRVTLEQAMRTLKKAYRACPAGEEAVLAVKFRAILEALQASIDVARPVAVERLKNL